jgi:hypothetical protein
MLSGSVVNEQQGGFLVACFCFNRARAQLVVLRQCYGGVSGETMDLRRTAGAKFPSPASAW